MPDEDYNFKQIVSPHLSALSVQAEVARRIIDTGIFRTPSPDGYWAVIPDALYNELCNEAQMQVTSLDFTIGDATVECEIRRMGDSRERRSR